MIRGALAAALTGLLLALAPAARAQLPLGPAAPPRTATVDIVADRSAAIPAAEYLIGVRLRHEPGWHTYWLFPGESGLATEVRWNLPRGWSVEPLEWPLPQVKRLAGMTSFVYDGEVLLPFRLEVPWGAAYGSNQKISAQVEWLACRDICVPGQATAEFTVPIRTSSLPSNEAPLFAEALGNAPERARANYISGTLDGSRLRLDFAPLAGRIAGVARFLPEREGLIDLRVPPRQESVDGTTSIYLRAHPDLVSAGPPLTLPGVVVADDGPLAGGWAIRTEIPVRAGPVAGRDEPPPAVLSQAPVSVAAPSAEPAPAPTRLSAPGGVPMSARLALGLAFLGGLLLNLMPCVFPVLSLKILGLVDSDRRRGPLAWHGLMFSAGLLLTMLALAAALLALRRLGLAIGWGFQLQSPWVVAALALLFMAIALNLCGLFEFKSVSHLVDSSTARALPTTGPAGSFWTGALAVIVASPCTAPFMSAALGYAITQEPTVALLIFAALGLGMALPWLLLTLCPIWVRWLPRPGRWMIRFKRIMALPLFAAMGWLLWVLTRQVDAFGLITLALAAGALLAFLWAVGREQYGRGSSAALRCLSGLVALGCLLLIGLGRFDQPPSEASAADGWEPWSAAAAREAQSSGQLTLVDFSAAWCATCLFNQATVINSAESRALLGSLGYRRLLADWTNRDPEIAAALNSYGRSGVPLYLLFDRHGQVTVLPELLSQSAFSAALSENAAR